MNFRPGELTVPDAVRLNEMFRVLEQFRKLNVAAPLSMTNAGGVPVIRLGVTVPDADGDIPRYFQQAQSVVAVAADQTYTDCDAELALPVGRYFVYAQVSVIGAALTNPASEVWVVGAVLTGVSILDKATAVYKRDTGQFVGTATLAFEWVVTTPQTLKLTVWVRYGSGTFTSAPTTGSTGDTHIGAIKLDRVPGGSGPAGPAGATGATGAAGATGPAGADGADGADGANTPDDSNAVLGMQLYMP